ncbi:MAG: MFS transporter [Alphaproteobacteria bacterium]|nr:MFS transporter [Alphaproteobacteria bacterium]
MRHTIGGLAALFLGAGLLLLGHGLLTTLLAVRANLEGFPDTLIGGIGTAYYAGFFAGCVFLPPLMRRVGHIRMFSAAGALVAAAALGLGLFVEPWTWLPVRFCTGFAMATMFMAVESWLNVRATNATRGRVIGIYMVINLGAATAAQQGLRLALPGGLDLFAIAALLVCLGLLPVALTRSEQPPTPPSVRLDLRRLVRLSPMGTVGVFLSGLITSPFWTLGAVYAQRQGFDLATTTVFLSTVILGGMAMQWPLGWLSDRVDRRAVLIGVFGLVALVSATLAASSWLPFVLPFSAWLGLAAAFGGTAFCVNALCVSHVNDLMGDGDRISVSAGLLLLFGAGAIVSPVLAGFTMAEFGPGGMFGQIAVVAAFGMLFAAIRRRARPAPPDAQKEPFVAVPRTTPAAIPLDPRVSAEEAGFEDVPLADTGA